MAARTADTGHGDSPGDTLLTAREAADHVGVNERTVRRAIARGALPAIKRHGAFAITLAALTSWREQPSAPVSIPPASRLSLQIRPEPALPRPLTSLIGREREAALAEAMLRRPEVRLLTMTGPGGVGKTRLALGVAADARATFPDGVWFVPLAGVADADGVVDAILNALGVTTLGEQSPGDALLTALRPGHGLLVLDNFEHVVEAAPLLANLLTACPELHLLVTSRTLLRLSGEYALPVPPLALPDTSTIVSPDTAGVSPAVKLFVERATALMPSFALDATTTAPVVEICRLLDGLPLAIELAAAWIPSVSLPALHDRLKRRVSLLTGGTRDAPPRHRTMRDAIAWSYDLLTPDEQAFFRRLAIFNGGCRLDAAIAVCAMSPAGAAAQIPDRSGCDPSPSRDPLHLIATLVDHSLIRRERDPDGQPRYAMLETIRAFGLEQLDRNGERDAAQRARAAWVRALAERTADASFAPEGDRLLALVEAEYRNLQEALAWLAETENGPGLLGLAGALATTWFTLGHYREGRAWLTRALDDCDEDGGEGRARALIGLGFIATYQNDGARARSSFEEGLRRWREAGNSSQQAIALIGLGVLANLQGDHAQATERLVEALRLSDSINDPAFASFIAGTAHANLGVAAQGQAMLPEAAAHHEEALRIRRAGTYTLGLSRTLVDLGDVARQRGQLALALGHYRESLAVPLELVDRRVIADILAGAAHIAMSWGQAERGARLLGAAASLQATLGTNVPLEDDHLAHHPGVAAARATLGETAFAAAWSAGRTGGIVPAVADVMEIRPPAGEVMPPGEDTGRRAHPRAGGTRPPAKLTEREVEVLRLLAAGHRDREIAERLFLSVRTVEGHVAQMLAKLDVSSRLQAVNTARAQGLIGPVMGAGPPR